MLVAEAVLAAEVAVGGVDGAEVALVGAGVQALWFDGRRLQLIQQPVDRGGKPAGRRQVAERAQRRAGDRLADQPQPLHGAQRRGRARSGRPRDVAEERGKGRDGATEQVSGLTFEANDVVARRHDQDGIGPGNRLEALEDLGGAPRVRRSADHRKGH